MPDNSKLSTENSQLPTGNSQLTTVNSQLSTHNWPSVTALCPTYGRFQRLRDAVACFLLQDYPGKKRLLILNDAPEPILCLQPGACSVRNQPRFPTLGHKRQALLEAARTPLVAHWDDDDLYLPWHLTQCVQVLQREGVSCVKPGAAWWAVGPREDLQVRGIRHNVFEGQMVFRRDRALDLGGYPPKVSGQAKALLDAFRRAGELHTWNPPDERISYVYRWADGAGHISARGDSRASHDGFAERNRDFADGRPLIPAADAPSWAAERVGGQFAGLAGATPQFMTRPGVEAIRRALGASLGQRESF